MKKTFQTKLNLVDRNILSNDGLIMAMHNHGMISIKSVKTIKSWYSKNWHRSDFSLFDFFNKISESIVCKFMQDTNTMTKQLYIASVSYQLALCIKSLAYQRYNSFKKYAVLDQIATSRLMDKNSSITSLIHYTRQIKMCYESDLMV